MSWGLESRIRYAGVAEVKAKFSLECGNDLLLLLVLMSKLGVSCAEALDIGSVSETNGFEVC
jgi:hypothetical protein